MGASSSSWNVERIRAYCVWDNDNWNMSNWNTTAWDVDAGANAGQNMRIAIIDTWMDYYVGGQGGVHIYPDLAQNVAVNGARAKIDTAIVRSFLIAMQLVYLLCAACA